MGISWLGVRQRQPDSSCPLEGTIRLKGEAGSTLARAPRRNIEPIPASAQVERERESLSDGPIRPKMDNGPRLSPIVGHDPSWFGGSIFAPTMPGLTHNPKYNGEYVRDEDAPASALWPRPQAPALG